MHEKHAEFYGLSCMTNMQDVLGFYIKENSVWCIPVCMTNMFILKKTQFGVLLYA